MAFTECHTIGHSWSVSGLSTHGGAKVIHLLCTRCTAVRDDPVTSTGAVVGRKYTYPDGYLLAKGDEKLSRPEHRMALLSEMLGALKRAGKK